MNPGSSSSLRPRVAAAAALIVVWGAAAGPALAQDSVVTRRASDARMKGAADAPITVFELADFECPFCRRFTDEVLQQLDSAYIATGKVRWVYVNYPLPNHARAWVAAEAAMCVGGAGGDFWRAHDAFFERQDEWAHGADPAGAFAAIAAEAGADAAQWRRCVDEDLVAPVLIQDLMSAAQTGASGTPAFIIDQRELFVGVRPFEEWVPVLEAALERAAEEVEEGEGGG
jgi:protein-disulfide isomerase